MSDLDWFSDISEVLSNFYLWLCEDITLKNIIFYICPNKKAQK